MKKLRKRWIPFRLWRSKYIRRFSISILISLVLIGRSMVAPTIAAVSNAPPQVVETQQEDLSSAMVLEVDVKSSAEDLTGT